jgi:hypothetical protein
MRPRALVLMLALLLVAGSAGAEIYKWVDENGTVHFSQSPPPQRPEAVEVIPEQPAAPLVEGGPERPTPGGPPPTPAPPAARRAPFVVGPNTGASTPAVGGGEEVIVVPDEGHPEGYRPLTPQEREAVRERVESRRATEPLPVAEPAPAPVAPRVAPAPGTAAGAPPAAAARGGFRGGRR